MNSLIKQISNKRQDYPYNIPILPLKTVIRRLIPPFYRFYPYLFTIVIVNDPVPSDARAVNAVVSLELFSVQTAIFSADNHADCICEAQAVAARYFAKKLIYFVHVTCAIG